MIRNLIGLNWIKKFLLKFFNFMNLFLNFLYKNQQKFGFENQKKLDLK